MKALNSNIRVFSRFRPLNFKEISQSNSTCIEFLNEKELCVLNGGETDNNGKNFTFDYVFKEDSSQEEVYVKAAKPIVESITEGYNGTFIAYGQTSSGKTYTIHGPSITDSRLKGIIPRAVDDLFLWVENTPDSFEFRIKVSIFEIYNERVRDLLDLSKSNLKIRECKMRGTYVQDLTEIWISEPTEIYNLVSIANNNRAVAHTNMGQTSSRSHLVFNLTLFQQNVVTYNGKSGKLVIVDLAGSEKVKESGVEGDKLKEAISINSSLTPLGLVINSLAKGGNSQTALIVNCSSWLGYRSETLSSLGFGSRALLIKNKPVINRELTIDELKMRLSTSEETIREKDRYILALQGELIKNNLNFPSIKIVQEQSIVNKETDQTRLTESLSENEHLREILEFKRELNDKTQILEDERRKLHDISNDFSALQAHTSSLEFENTSLKTQLLELTQKLENLESIANSVNVEKKDKATWVMNEQLMMQSNTVSIQNQVPSGKKAQRISALLDLFKKSSNEDSSEKKSKLVNLLQNNFEKIRNMRSVQISEKNEDFSLQLNNLNEFSVPFSNDMSLLVRSPISESRPKSTNSRSYIPSKPRRSSPISKPKLQPTKKSHGIKKEGNEDLINEIKEKDSHILDLENKLEIEKQRAEDLIIAIEEKFQAEKKIVIQYANQKLKENNYDFAQRRRFDKLSASYDKLLIAYETLLIQKASFSANKEISKLIENSMLDHSIVSKKDSEYNFYSVNKESIMMRNRPKVYNLSSARIIKTIKGGVKDYSNK